jgi:hypothetical protein
MIVLMGFSIWRVLIGVLSVSLLLLFAIIAYKKLLSYFKRGTLEPQDYCILNELETHPATGEVEFYFTSTIKRKAALEILNDDMSFHSLIIEKEVEPGGTIVRFNTEILPNGPYFYQLKTDNQKTMKRFSVFN